MIQLTPKDPALGWAAPTTPSWRTDTQAGALWFDSESTLATASLCADLRADARGLSVQEHAQRVLSHLCGPRP